MVKKQAFNLMAFIGLLGCDLPKETSTISTNFQCMTHQNTCQIDTRNGQFYVSFNAPKVVAEVPFAINVKYHGSGKLTSLKGYMEGVHMYMGKIPLIFDKETPLNSDDHISDLALGKSYVAETMLGSCSENKMRWKIWFSAEVLESNVTKEQSFFIEFDSFQTL